MDIAVPEALSDAYPGAAAPLAAEQVASVEGAGEPGVEASPAGSEGPSGDDQSLSSGPSSGESGDGAEFVELDGKRYVPAERLTEAQQKASDLDPWAPVIRELQRDFQSPEQMRARFAQDAEMGRYRSTVQRMANSIQDRLEVGELSPREAEAEFRAEQVRLQGELDRQRYAQQMLELQMPELHKQYPEMDEEAVRFWFHQGKDAAMVAKATHDRMLGFRDRVIGQYNQTKATQARQTGVLPETGGGASVAPAGMPDPVAHPGQFDAWFAQQVSRGRGPGGGDILRSR